MILKKIFNKLGVKRYYNVQRNGKTFQIPIFNRIGFANFAHTEPWMDNVLKRLGGNDKRLLDIGVNVGQTLMKWKSLYPNAYYLGVEPNVACVAYVNDLIEKNQIKNASVLPVALSDRPGLIFLYTSSTDPSDIAGTTIENFREEGGERAIPIASLSFNEITTDKPFDLIKIDVEGAESDVIESIFKANPANNPTILCEILPVYKKENTDRLERQNKIAQILAENKYAIFRIMKSPKLAIVELNEFDIHADMELCEYIFVHQNEKENLIAHFN